MVRNYQLERRGGRGENTGERDNGMMIPEKRKHDNHSSADGISLLLQLKVRKFIQ